MGDFDHVRTLMTCSVWQGQYTWWTLNASLVSAHDQKPPRLSTAPLMLKRTFRYKIKQSGGGEPGDEAIVGVHCTVTI